MVQRISFILSIASPSYCYYHAYARSNMVDCSLVDLLPTTTALLHILSDPDPSSTEFATSTTLNSLSLLHFPLPTNTLAHPVLPETTLISLLTLAVKLFHPFTPSTTLYAKALSDPNSFTIDWDVWVEAHAVYDAKEKEILARPLMPGTEDKISEEDVLNMTGEEMDAYMDWCGSVLADQSLDTVRHGTRPIPNEILKMFPIDRQGNLEQTSPREGKISDEVIKERIEHANEERLKTVQAALKVRVIISEEKEKELAAKRRKVSRLGQDYKIYRNVEDLEGIAKNFYQKAADMAGLDLETLVDEVHRYDYKVDVMGRERRRQEGVDLRRTVWTEQRKKKVRLSSRRLVERAGKLNIEAEAEVDDDQMSVD